MYNFVSGLVDAEKLEPGDLVGVNKDSYLILDTLPPGENIADQHDMSQPKTSATVNSSISYWLSYWWVLNTNWLIIQNMILV